MKILKHLIAFAFILGMSSMASAAIPPPPVNQNLGIPDTSFSNFDASLCKACHHASANDLEPLSGAPVKVGYNPDRHHLAVDTEIDGKPEYPPERDANGDGVTDTHFGCLNCHIVVTQGVDIETAILIDVIELNYRDCLICHKRAAGPLTVHHATELAQTGFCFKCHGGLVRGIDVDTLKGKKPDPSDDNGTVPVVVPEYPHSMITPWRSKKPNGDDSQENHAGTEPGNCNFCHNTAIGSTETTGDKNGTMQIVNLPDGSTFNAPVLTNAQNHHNTGFYDDDRCAWCHNLEFGETGVQKGGDAIRICQRCHDRTTLHNIEFDNDGDGITAGKEDPYYGHIGNQKNCWGCHGNNKTVLNDDGIWVSPRDYLGVDNQGIVVGDEDQAEISVVTALIPTISQLSIDKVVEGEETLITITGMNMVNSNLHRKYIRGDDGKILRDENNSLVSETYTTTLISMVVITDKNGNVTVIEPSYQDRAKLEFTLPSTMASGFYQVTLKKNFPRSSVVNGEIIKGEDQHISNPLGLMVKKSIIIQQSFVFTPYGGLVFLSGSNFMEVLNGMTYKLVDQDGNAPLTTYVWNDSLVVVHFNDIPESVTMTNLHGTKVIPLVKY